MMKLQDTDDMYWYEEQNERKRRKRSGLSRVPVILLVISVVLLAVASIMSAIVQRNQPGNNQVQNPAATYEPLMPGSYDSEDTAVLVDWNKDAGTFTFLNLDKEREYTLTMDGTTRFYDKYGTVLSKEQIRLGDVVDIAFMKEAKTLTTLKLSDDAWTYSNVERYEIDATRKEVKVGTETFKISSSTQYISENHHIELMDINAADVLTFQGIGSRILSVTVEKGHGYLRLDNDELFIGGWIEIGQTNIRKITEGMLLLVPEGSYQVNISYNGGGGTKNIVVYRNEETTLDIGDLEVPNPDTGMVLFSLTPSNAKLYVDGTLVDASYPITLRYGLHQLIAQADGYHSIVQYIRVAQASAGINVILDELIQYEDDDTEIEPDDKKDDESDDKDNDSDTNPDNTPAPDNNDNKDKDNNDKKDESDKDNNDGDDSDDDTTTDYYMVYIDAPQDVEVYVDGNYVGVAPCGFKKKAGTYVITLRKLGYETRSYTVTVDDNEKDLTYSFADLEEMP